MNRHHNMSATSTPSRQKRRAERTRARLLDAALELFVEKGYDAVTIGEIPERADLGAGTYYLHFKDKRSVYEAVVRRELLALRTRWLEERRARETSGGPAAEITLMVEIVLESLLGNVDQAKLVLLDGPPLESWLLEEIGREMAQVLGDGVTMPELAANLVIGATLNAARWALTRPRLVSRKRLVESVVEFCSAGLVARGLSKPAPRR